MRNYPYDIVTNVDAAMKRAALTNILLAHGSGGTLTQELLTDLFLPYFGNAILNRAHDGAVMTIGSQKLAFSTDTFVVKPSFFPGGNIGDLAINGTVNDVAMCGAKPLFLAAGFLLEEGFPMDQLHTIVATMASAAKAAGVQLVTGDTKVVEHGCGDGIYINTTGIGAIDDAVDIGPELAKPGDIVIINGHIGNHGIAVMSKREGIAFETVIESDTAPLNGLIAAILAVSKNVHVLRDPTRGGLAGTLCEIASASNVGIMLQQDQLPIDPEVTSACEILGLDPLYIANEGKVIVIAPEQDAKDILQIMRQHRFGQDSTIIGHIMAEHPNKVLLETDLGTVRIVDLPDGEQMPRIC